MQGAPSADSVAALILAVAQAADPALPLSLAERRVALFRAVGELIEADLWTWVTGTRNPDHHGDAMHTRYVDHGFRSDEERGEYLRISLHPDLAPVAYAALTDAMNRGTSITLSRTQLVDETCDPGRRVMQEWEAAGFGDFIISAYPLGGQGHTALGYHRRYGRPKFSEADRQIVSLAFERVPWLHQSNTPAETAAQVIKLSPRERQVISCLMKGDSRKQVARVLKLSEHTITDYVKALYRKFGVNSRAELLAKFLDGEPSH